MNLTLQSKVVGTELYSQLFNAGTFNAATTLVDRKAAVQSLKLTQAYLKVQTQIAIHKVAFPKQATEVDITSFFTTNNMSYNSDNSFALTFNHGASTSDFYKYNLLVEDITRNFLTQQSMLDVVNLADAISSGASAVALTFGELASIGKT